MRCVHYRAAPLERVRRTIASMVDRATDTRGWEQSDVDPMAVLALFPCLRVRSGFVLRAYRFVQGGNGNGIVWAMPSDAPFPAPNDCERLQGSLLEPPRPTGALPEVMSVIESDGTPRSYLWASILARELAEFAALWHGVSWGDCHVLDRWPLGDAYSAEERWTWLEPRPADLRPRVEQDATGTTVTFHTVTALEQERVHRHVDRYPPGSCDFTSTITVVADGQGGYIH